MFVKATKIEKFLNEASEKRLKEFEKEVAARDPENVTDEDGFNIEYYKNIGLPVPEELLLKSKYEDTIEFHLENDYDTFYRDILINTDSIEEVEQHDNYTVIYYSNGREITVMEKLETLNNSINK